MITHLLNKCKEIIANYILRDFAFYKIDTHLKIFLKSKFLFFYPKRFGPKFIHRKITQDSPYAHYEKREDVFEFQHYGHDYVLKRFSSISRNYNSKITAEHGCFFHDQCYMLDKYQKLRHVLTMSKRRRGILRRLGIKSYDIGPYIHYATYHLSNEQITSRKKDLGRVITYFPQHSHEKKGYIDDHKKNLMSIRKVIDKYEIDTLFICYYWHDLKKGMENKYSSIDHMPVCAGHRSNPFFLDNLKLILAFSDFTISNDIGTYSGYSIFLNKPHVIIKEGKNEKTSVNREPFLLDNALNHFDQQYDLCNDYWGFESIREEQEIKSLLIE